MKHGPIALIDEEMPVVAVAVHDHVYEKTLNNVAQVKARGGILIGLGNDGDEELAQASDHLVTIPGGQRTPHADSRGTAAPAPRLPLRRPSRLRRRPATQPGKISNGGVTTEVGPRTEFPLPGGTRRESRRRAAR